jgi:putative ABC transport system permease protein
MRALRFAARSLARTPLFTLTAVAILSLSIGAATAVFSLLHALVLRPLPVRDADQLVRVTTVDRRGSNGDLTWRMYRELAANQRVFSTLIPALDQSVMELESSRGVERGAVAGASGNVFEELGATPALGRLLQPADVDFTAPSGEPVAVLGWSFWQRHFFADPSVIGQSIKVDGVPLTIVGVAPKDFLGFSVTVDHDLWIPIGLLPRVMQSEVSMVRGTSRWISTFGRLAPGVTMEQARAQITAMWPSLLEAAQPDQYRNIQKEDFLRIGVKLDSGATGVERGLRSRYTQPLYALLGIAGLVLIIAAANLAALVFARAQARNQELAVKLALGAERGRVIRECAAEGAWIGTAGAIGGIAVAAIASDGIVDFLLRDYVVRTSLNVVPDATVIAIASSISLLLATLATAIAAIIGTRRTALVPGGGRTVARTSRVGRILVGAQIAASIVMLAHASLLVRSVYAITAIDNGLTNDTVVIGYPGPRLDAYRSLDVGTYYQQALDRVMAVPGVTSAAFSTFKPDGGGLPTEPVGVGGTPREAGDLQAGSPQVSPGFFQTMGLTVLRGRDFTYADTVQSRKVTVISQAVERKLFGDGQGLGQRIRVSARPEWQDVEVIGVVNDARVYDVRGDNLAMAYTAAVQSGDASHYKCLVARAPASAAPELKKAIESLGIELMPRTQTLAYARSRAILQERLMAALGSAFALLALVLVAAGIYGLLSYVFSLRRKEIGIRMALGADARLMSRKIVLDGLVVTALGITVGLIGAIASVPLLRSVLVHVSPYDPIAIGAACVVLLMVTLGASLAPAARAARVEPLAELRQD